MLLLILEVNKHMYLSFDPFGRVKELFPSFFHAQTANQPQGEEIQPASSCLLLLKDWFVHVRFSRKNRNLEEWLESGQLIFSDGIFSTCSSYVLYAFYL